MEFEAVVFDLFYTLVQPGEYPGGGDRAAWLARQLGVSESALEASWAAFEPELESGSAHAKAPELTWLSTTYRQLTGRPIQPDLLDSIEGDWDLTRRQALLHPPQAIVDTLRALRGDGLKVGVLSNTHALESRSWERSPLARLVDAAGFSHEIGVMKPDPGAYAVFLDRLGVPPERCVYVGDGTGDELAGARRAGFAAIVLAAEAPTKLAPDQLPALEAQADLVIPDLVSLPSVLARASQ